jgi:hypothetical protein
MYEHKSFNPSVLAMHRSMVLRNCPCNINQDKKINKMTIIDSCLKSSLLKTVNSNKMGNLAGYNSDRIKTKYLLCLVIC